MILDLLLHRQAGRLPPVFLMLQLFHSSTRFSSSTLLLYTFQLRFLCPANIFSVAAYFSAYCCICPNTDWPDFAEILYSLVVFHKLKCKLWDFQQLPLFHYVWWLSFCLCLDWFSVSILAVFCTVIKSTVHLREIQKWATPCPYSIGLQASV